MASLSWDHLPIIATAVLTLGLAGVLLYLDFQKRANRAFALLLILRGVALIVGTLRNASNTPQEFEFFQRLLPYFQLAMVPAFVYFLMVYPRARTWIGNRPWGAWLLLAFALLIEILYASNHSLYWSYEEGIASSAILNAGHGFRYTGFGPLALLGQLSVPMGCVAAIVFANDYLHEKPGGARFSLVLIVAGLILSSLFVGVQQVFGVAQQVASPGEFPWMPWGWAFALPPLLTLPLALMAIGVIWLGSRRTPNPQDDVEARRLLWAAPVPILSALYVSIVSEDVFGDELAVFTIGLWRMLMPVLVTYALLRYRLFDLDVKARITIHYGSVLAVFGAVFFLVSEMVEGLISSRAGDWAGLLAAAGLTLAVKPLERFGGKLAKRVLPSARPIHEMNEKQRQQLYRDQFAMALQDGRLTDSERKMLADLQQKLGLQITAAPAEPPKRNDKGRRGSHDA